MSIVEPPNSLADVVRALGDIDLSRIRMQPAPGTATAADVESIRAREKRLFELVDGILVEKVTGFRESLVAVFLARVIGDWVAQRNLGLVVGADGMMRLFPQTVRIPDVAFLSWSKLPGGRVPSQAIPEISPTIAIEVLSQSKTAGEMSRKREDYFRSGVEIVWEVDIDQRVITVFTAPEGSSPLTESDTLTAETVLPGFRLPVAQVFAELDRRESDV